MVVATTQRTETIRLAGGLDQLTPTLQIRPGYVRDALNWEQSITGGYSRIAGYERHDGRPAPSAAQYLTLTLNITGALAVGNTITGVTSGATGVVISIGTPLTASVVAFTKSTGSFVAAETINVGGTPRATVTALGGSGTDADYDVTQKALAADVYRADILAPTGSGANRGGFQLGGMTYTFRDNAGATALVMYKESSSGWTVVPLGFELGYNTGTVEYTPGETVTRGGASAVIMAITVESGTWGAGTAAGRMILASVTGGPFTAGASAGGGVAVLTGAETAITLLPGGKVATDFGNFGAGRRVYGCDGVNRGWEFDGTTFVPIVTGNSPDAPNHVLVHRDHLFFAFGSSLQHSSIASATNLYPQYNWTALAGAAEYPMPDTITALLRQPGSQEVGAMSISLASATTMFYGNSAADFRPVPFEESAGARAYGAQRIGGQSLCFGDLGIFSITATQNFGNFIPATLTMTIRPFTQVRRNIVTASLVNREKSQYRVFFSDGTGLYMTVVNNKVMGAMPVSFPNPVSVAWPGQTPDGNETAFFGSTDGFVYRLDAGTSHDGDEIVSFFTLPFANQGNARTLKRYMMGAFEVQGASYATFNVTYELGYADSDIQQGTAPTGIALNLSPVFWDEFTWDEFTWDGRQLAPGQMKISGTAENIALRIDSTSAKFQQFTINSIVLHFINRRILR